MPAPVLGTAQGLLPGNTRGGRWASRSTSRSGPGTIALPTIAVEWLQKVEALAGNAECLLPRRKRQRRMMPHACESTLGGAMGTVPQGRPHFTVHDWRRAARTHRAALGAEPHVAERCLNHRSKGVEGLDNRHDGWSRRVRPAWPRREAALVGQAEQPVVASMQPRPVIVALDDLALGVVRQHPGGHAAEVVEPLAQGAARPCSRPASAAPAASRSAPPARARPSAVPGPSCRAITAPLAPAGHYAQLRCSLLGQHRRPRGRQLRPGGSD